MTSELDLQVRRKRFCGALHLDNNNDNGSHLLRTDYHMPGSAMHSTQVFPSQKGTYVCDTHTCKAMKGLHHSSCWKLILLMVLATHVCGATEEALSYMCKERLPFDI